MLECCGAAATSDFRLDVAYEVDVAVTALPDQPRHDVFVTRADCPRLFDGSYPPAAGTSARCAVLLGPVAPGSISARRQLEAGVYRVHAQSFSTTSARSAFLVDIAIWGPDCSARSYVP